MPKRYNIPRKTVALVYSKTQGRCFYCNKEFPPDTNFYDEGGKVVSSKRNWHVDHSVPVSKGGTYNIDNLFPSCSSCNEKKGAK